MENKLLSIFIPTFNRGHLISETLDSFIEQIAEYQIPIIISDNCSTDDTFHVVQSYICKYPFIKYSKNPANLGFDGNVVKMTGLVSTKYCWLFGDDDIINKGAIDIVLKAIKNNFDLVVVNASLNSVDLSSQIAYRHLAIDKDKLYTGEEIEKAFLDLVSYTSFIGGLIIKKELWDNVDFTKYLKTGFVHVGISYEYLNKNSKVYYVAEPLVTIRLGNSGWSRNSFEIWYVLWCRVIKSLPNYTSSIKKMVYIDFSEISIKGYLRERARGAFRSDVYKRFIKNDISIPIKKKYSLLLILLIPIPFLRFFWKLYLIYKKPPSLEYQLFELNNSISKETNFL
jgi:GT2 family glycosyltransferase